MKKDTIFWDVDTQYDFMMPDGILYVPGAETIIDKLSQVRKFALENGFSIVADIDWHSTDNEEISDAPDFNKTFPPHCIADSKGALRLGFLGNLPIEYVEMEKMSEKDLQNLINKDQFHIVIKKHTTNVFDNPNTDKLIELLKPKAAIVFGVALDFCVFYVLQGLTRHPDIKLYLLKDITKGLGTRSESEIFDELREMGVEIIQFSDFRRLPVCG
jgi:nicotinamidase/pyrazinamidase